jgi:hypothetical protein
LFLTFKEIIEACSLEILEIDEELGLVCELQSPWLSVFCSSLHLVFGMFRFHCLKARECNQEQLSVLSQFHKSKVVAPSR